MTQAASPSVGRGYRRIAANAPSSSSPTPRGRSGTIPGRGGGGGAYGAPQPGRSAGAGGGCSVDQPGRWGGGGGGCSVDQPGGGVVDPGAVQSGPPLPGSEPMTTASRASEEVIVSEGLPNPLGMSPRGPGPRGRGPSA